MNKPTKKQKIEMLGIANAFLKAEIVELEEQEEKNERTIKNMGLAIALAQEWTKEKDDKIVELEAALKRLLDVTLWVDSGCKQLGAAEQAAREALKEHVK